MQIYAWRMTFARHKIGSNSKKALSDSTGVRRHYSIKKRSPDPTVVSFWTIMQVCAGIIMIVEIVGLRIKLVIEERNMGVRSAQRYMSIGGAFRE